MAGLGLAPPTEKLNHTGASWAKDLCTSRPGWPILLEIRIASFARQLPHQLVIAKCTLLTAFVYGMPSKAEGLEPWTVPGREM